MSDPYFLTLATLILLSKTCLHCTLPPKQCLEARLSMCPVSRYPMRNIRGNLNPRTISSMTQLFSRFDGRLLVRQRVSTTVPASAGRRC